MAGDIHGRYSVQILKKHFILLIERLQLIESHKSEWIRVFVERKTSSYKTLSIIEVFYQLCSNTV